MKKLFTTITVLITISLVGISIIQVSWLRNMVLLQEEQVKEKLDRALGYIQTDLDSYKQTPISINTLRGSELFGPNFHIELQNSYLLGKRFSAMELEEKIREGLNKAGLGKIKFEFLLLSGAHNQYKDPEIQKMSKRFLLEYSDTLNNYVRSIGFRPKSGTFEEDFGEETLNVVLVEYKNFALRALIPRIAISIIFTLIILTAFFLTVYTMLKQKKLGEIKNDFINNMTHEFKTPLATISLAVDALRNDKVMGSPEKIGYFTSIIKEENQRMNRQVETILKASQLEKNEVELNVKPLHLHEIIENVMDNFALQLETKNGEADLQLDATNDFIDGDEVHITNLVNNLIDNATKYSKVNVPLHLTIQTSSDSKNLYFKVTDNGIGMSKETAKRVFEKFYRAHTGNLHNVKGFGLGLSYVQSMVQAHHGTVKVESTLGKGSTFTISLPLKKQ